MQLLICSHPAFVSAPETHFFSHVLEPIEGWRNQPISAEVLDMVWSRLADKAAIKVSAEFKNSIRQVAGKRGIDVATLLDCVMQHLCGINGDSESRWVEKTPRHALHIDDILGFFPSARVVAVIRDPRDVASSPSPYGSFTTAAEWRKFRMSRAHLWNRIAKSFQEARDDERVRIVRYEDLVGDTAGELRMTMAFLGEDATPRMIEDFSSGFDSVVTPKEAAHKEMCAAGKIVDRRGIWKRRLSRQEAWRIEAECSHHMNEFRYRRSLPGLMFSILKS